MKKERTNLYKIFWFCKSPFTGVGKYLPFNGLWHSVDELLNFMENFSDSGRLTAFHLRTCSLIKIPFFGYHSPQFTALDPRGLAVYEKAEV